MSLTDATIRNAQAVAGKTIKLSDGGGLQVWVTSSGSKLWNLAYRFAGKQRKLAVGPYPRIGLKEARQRRDDAKRQIEGGVDPSLQKRLDRLSAASEQATTFGVIAFELMDKKRREAKADRTLAKLEWLFSLATPTLGQRPIAGITAPEILQVLRAVETRGKLETAKRLRAVIGEVFRYTVATGRAESDPTTALRGALTTPVVRHRAAIVEPKAFSALLRSIDGYDGMPEVRIALQLLALTFVRPGELRSALWSEINLDDAVWTIPAEKMKMRRPHRVPLAKQAIELLRGLHRLTGHRELLLPGAWDHRKPLSENTLNAALRRLGFSQDEMSSHGFRATASSMLNESGKWNADAIEAQLAHVEGNAVRRAYARAEFWEERVRMMTWWADRLDDKQRVQQVARKLVAVQTASLEDIFTIWDREWGT
jgi:integrase